MTTYITSNIKLSNSQLNKLILGIKNSTEVALNFSSNLIGNFSNEASFPHKLLLNDTQVSRICKVLANGSSGNITFSKTQVSKIMQSRRFIYDIPILPVFYWIYLEGTYIAGDFRQDFLDKQTDLIHE